MNWESMQMNKIQYDALGMTEEEITSEIMHKMLDEILAQLNKGEKSNAARLERAVLDDDGNMTIKQYYLTVSFGERDVI